MRETSGAISPLLTSHYKMNDDQRTIIAHKQGPLRVIAGPGSGKTYSLTLLAMNLLLCDDTPPEGIVLCTYTQKAAYEMQDRLLEIARTIGYTQDLSQIKIGTIHSICKQFLIRHLHHTPLGNNFETLDQFSQQMLIYRHLDELCGPGMLRFLGEQWGNGWQIAKKLQFLCDKIAEELIIDKLLQEFPRPYLDASSDQRTLTSMLPHIYLKYAELLRDANYVDFAHLQKYAYDLLQQPAVFQNIAQHIRYVLVDEYQDTNYIQEQILSRLASANDQHNLCVVGDEDQALYRFRGATVRNILEFAQTFPDCKQVQLTINYRSHAAIIATCNQWMDTLNASLPHAPEHLSSIFRTEKTIRSALPAAETAHYPAVITLETRDNYDEAEQFARLIYELKQEGRIQDYSQVAILLHSVRSFYSQPYIDALNKYHISAYCPRARNYFNQPEIQLLLGCFAQLLHLQEAEFTPEQENFMLYLQTCRELLTQTCQRHRDLTTELHTIQEEIWTTSEWSETAEKQLADYFYRFIFTSAFDIYRADKHALASLVIFSQHLKAFLTSFQHTNLSTRNLAVIQYDFFHTFLYFLHLDGVNQFENPDELVPLDHVQIMTIHQAKGLEFPVVIVGRLDKAPPQGSNEDKGLRPYYQREPIEPEKYIPAFDMRRLFYVAFSRARQVLILSAPQKPHSQFSLLWYNTQALEYHYRELMMSMPPAEAVQPHEPPKRRLSLTSHIALYDTCPRQFEYLREHNFSPAHTKNTFYGQLIHQTLEGIHRLALEQPLSSVHENLILELFERTFYFLTCSGMTPLDRTSKHKALVQILRYFDQNQALLNQVYDAEYNFQVEKDQYLLTGKMDLLLEGQEGLEIIDFKTGTRPEQDAAILAAYKQQLYLYAHALEHRTRQLPSRLYLYWTAEPARQDAMMEVPFHEENLEQVGSYFDTISHKILNKQFEVVTPPPPSVCQSCDIRYLCTKQGTISL
ncbi:ATP-dependent DNA helicase [Dictyobacter formicarum]|uniref:DNA 3'-5' helicase n=1 Tax=Dictyobacter formicarum TaxID=2778368 RepID=A0ABQ3VND7_9CHLR|nr:ATP-dependent DNA helicase [Dictyobacter formicarum]GHO87337.1 DNA helicase II [Dictyobacter formicarum]